MQELRETIMHHCDFLNIQDHSCRRRRRARGATYQYASVLTLFIPGLAHVHVERALLEALENILSNSGLPCQLQAGRLYVNNAERTCVVHIQLRPSLLG
jgi:hypothetical protein